MGSPLMNCPLGQLPVAAIDFESAGAAPGETDQPVQIGIVRVNSLFGAEEIFTSYIACERPVRWSAAKVHGITTDTLRGAPHFHELWGELRRLLSDCVVLGHNPSTEKRFLGVFPGHGFGPWLDTLALTRKALPTLPDHALGTVCEAMGLTPEVSALVPGKSWHDALYDAAGSLILLRALVHGLAMEQVTLRSIPFAVSQN